MGKYKVAIVGASGYTGSELARILLSHPLVQIEMITSEQHIGKPFSILHPQFTGILDQKLVTAEKVEGADLDVIFLALPHGVSMEFVKKWQNHKAKIIDLSGDFRLSESLVYENWYQKTHTFPEAVPGAVYGLPELHRKAIKNARLVANPGCYPTASILGLAPLMAKKLLVQDSIIIDAKSGTTGAGIKASNTTHFSNVNDNFKAYGIAGHRHTIEIEEQLGALAGDKPPVQFTPHLLPVDRGILATSYARIKEDMQQEKLLAIYRDFYKKEPFIRIRQQAPGIKEVRGSNFCDIYPIWDKRTGRVIVISVIDNLIKGAAGQAVHNMNLMLDLPEDTALGQIPLQP